MEKRWYFIQAHSSMEKNVERSLNERIARSGMDDMFGRVLVPTEEWSNAQWQTWLPSVVCIQVMC